MKKSIIHYENDIILLKGRLIEFEGFKESVSKSKKNQTKY